ncbi:MAG: gfo/Idh/MocA family oxidoreductase, partial [Firmicutes bacterium]|nr:gfo/Idh/MocA family oxidoreductase [Bacillota bacterium]
RRVGAADWSDMPLTHGFTEQGRGLGVADMAYAIRSGRAHRANGEMAYHVLEAMHGFHLASSQGRHHIMQSSCERPTPFPLDLPRDGLDA